MKFQKFIESNVIMKKYGDIILTPIKKEDTLYYLINFTGEKFKTRILSLKSFSSTYEFDNNPQFKILKDTFKDIHKLTFCINNNLPEFPKCEFCGCDLKFRGNQKSWILKTCGSKDCCKLQHEKTNMERCGFKWHNEDPVQKEKVKRVVQEKYGVNNVSQIESVKIKKEKTCLSHYGQTNPSRVPEIKSRVTAKVKETFKRKYGVNTIGEVLTLKNFRTASKLKYKYKDCIFDSKYELAFYIYCEDNNIPIIRNTDKCISYEVNGEAHLYFPDFIINDELIEIKGSWGIKEDGTWVPHPASLSRCKTEESKNRIKLRYLNKGKAANKLGVKIIGEKESIKFVKYCNNKYLNTKWHEAYKYRKN